MSDVRRYWQQVRDTEAAIQDPFVYVTSVESEANNLVGGRTCEVSRMQAARYLTDGTHQLSTEAQIKAFHVEEENNRRKAASTQANRISSIMARTILGAGDEAIAPHVAAAPPPPAEKTKK